MGALLAIIQLAGKLIKLFFGLLYCALKIIWGFIIVLFSFVRMLFGRLWNFFTVGRATRKLKKMSKELDSQPDDYYEQLLQKKSEG